MSTFYNIKYLFLFFLLIKFNFSINQIIYRKAELKDLSSILKLIKRASKDQEDIVFFPLKFRKKILKNDIKKGRIFIAKKKAKNYLCCIPYKKNEIIGFKKLFILEGNEKNEVLQNEIRCINKKKNEEDENELSINIYFNNSSKKNTEKKNLSIDSFKEDLTIYTGGDYTLPEYRGIGVNSNLIKFALEDTIKLLLFEEKKINSISIVYGLTKKNAGIDPKKSVYTIQHNLSILDGRTTNIFNVFKDFIESIKYNFFVHDKYSKNYINISRYNSFMPVFDQDLDPKKGDILKPLNDENCKKGFGYLMTYFI